MAIAGKSVLVTGANRGIGRALVEEALRRGAKRVYAGTRQSWGHWDERVTPVLLDVTNAAQIQASLEQVECLDIPINDAGVGVYDDLNDRAALEQHRPPRGPGGPERVDGDGDQLRDHPDGRWDRGPLLAPRSGADFECYDAWSSGKFFS
jgi:NAD(P)-dependent dehydrogenase (short-subunit alcohol dehydrogenase family)